MTITTHIGTFTYDQQTNCLTPLGEDPYCINPQHDQPDQDATYELARLIKSGIAVVGVLGHNFSSTGHWVLIDAERLLAIGWCARCTAEIAVERDHDPTGPAARATCHSLTAENPLERTSRPF